MNLQEKIEKLLTYNVEEVIVLNHLKTRLLKGENNLRIKLGADPSAPDLHLGHTVVLRKLREFQELGHSVIFIIGDFTAQIGDPTGRSKTRPQLDISTVEQNAKTYFEQVGKILDVKKCEIRYNSEWFSQWKARDLIELQAKFSLKRLLERDDFTKRMKDREGEIFAHEIDYPMLQAYDSIAVKASVEIGGTDQKFNMLAGRDLQRKLGLKEQEIITCPLLLGLDGKQKMSKSLGNYVGLNEPAGEMYGKIMSIPDDLIIHYFTLLTNFSSEEIKEIEEGIKKGMNPREAKARLAFEIVAMYHSKQAAIEAEKEFERIFRKKETPSNIPSVQISVSQISLIDLLVQTKLASSKSEARRLIRQKAIKVDGQVIEDIGAIVEVPKGGRLIQKGKRYFVKVIC
jgi:tyrosyl-tRNA synthetase